MNYTRLRKPDLLIVLTLLTGLGVLASTTANADETKLSDIDLFNNTSIDDLLDGDIQVAGDKHAGLHLSIGSRAQSTYYAGQNNTLIGNDPDVRFSWKVSW